MSSPPLLRTYWQFIRYQRFIHFGAPHLKRNALHDSENERREPVVVLLGVFHNLANGRRVVILDAPSEREGHQVFRQSRDEQFGTSQQRVFQSVDPSERLATRHGSRRIDW